MELKTLPPSCADFHEIWEPQPLEPTGPVQACNGIGLPFYTLEPLGYAASTFEIISEVYRFYPKIEQ